MASPALNTFGLTHSNYDENLRLPLPGQRVIVFPPDPRLT
jgi:hypothetical protein